MKAFLNDASHKSKKSSLQMFKTIKTYPNCLEKLRLLSLGVKKQNSLQKNLMGNLFPKRLDNS
jgi:hypothetical protein